MVLKLVSGQQKGISLASTRNARELKPTQALVREALMNILSNSCELSSLKVLDLYAGIGTVGLELLSNEVDFVSFIERDPKCIKVLKSNIMKLGYQKQTQVIAKPVLEGLKILNKSKPFDLVFGDPPYEQDEFAKTVGSLLERGLMAEDALLVWECADANLESKHANFINQKLDLNKKKKYGETFLYFFTKKYKI